jgi:single-strand selective monofunctional uracil DNA glycosylase
MSMPPASTAAALVRVSRALARAADALEFGDPVACVYDPLVYARAPHEAYLARARRDVDALFLGMNPGPFGMAQTGVPFGEVAAVRDYLGIDGPLKRPAREHDKRPIEGFACTRSEVSGRRFWGLMQGEFASADDFFERAFVWNWCPLLFVSASGSNLTPDKLPKAEQAPLVEVCDEALRGVVRALAPKTIVGVGVFASAAAKRALGDGAPPVATILHPSPASPAANRGWEEPTREALRAIGLFSR